MKDKTPKQKERKVLYRRYEGPKSKKNDREKSFIPLPVEGEITLVIIRL
jgi:hypothetical protein